MNLKEQQYVCTLARCRSLSRAAEALFISPSALSVYISKLEKSLGVPLFKRVGKEKSFVLTSIGEEYVQRAEKMLELKAEFDDLLKREQKKEQPVIRIGIQQRRAISMVPEVLARFKERYQDVELVFHDLVVADLKQMFKENAIDFMVSNFLEELPDTVYHEIAKEPVLLALPDTHPAIQYAYSVEGDAFQHLDLSYLDWETFIVPLPDQSMRRTVDRIFRENHIHPKRLIEIGHFDIIMSMVNQGMGVGFNRLGYLSDMQRFEHVRYFLINREAETSSFRLAYRKGHVLSDCEQHLISIIEETICRKLTYKEKRSEQRIRSASSFF